MQNASWYCIETIPKVEYFQRSYKIGNMIPRYKICEKSGPNANGQLQVFHQLRK